MLRRRPNPPPRDADEHDVGVADEYFFARLELDRRVQIVFIPRRQQVRLLQVLHAPITAPGENPRPLDKTGHQPTGNRPTDHTANFGREEGGTYSSPNPRIMASLARTFANASRPIQIGT
jgi:hypothetical protein